MLYLPSNTTEGGKSPRKSASPTRSLMRSAARNVSSPFEGRGSFSEAASPDLRILEENEHREYNVSFSRLCEALEEQSIDIGYRQTATEEEDIRIAFEEWLVSSKVIFRYNLTFR